MVPCPPQVSEKTRSPQIIFEPYELNCFFLKVDKGSKYKIKTNPNMCILMYFKIQSDQPRITRNAWLITSWLITLNFKVHQDAHIWSSKYRE